MFSHHIDSGKMAQLIEELAHNAFLINSPAFAKINDGKLVNEETITCIIEEKIKNETINPFVYAIMLGQNDSKYVEKMKECIQSFAAIRCHDGSEYFFHLGMYMLLINADSQSIEKLQLAPSLEKFVKDRLGRVPTVYYVAILYIFVFFLVLISQIYEVHTRFIAAPADCQKKLYTLYSSAERISMLVENSSNIAAQHISAYTLESREIIPFFSKFLAKNKKLVTTADIFNVQYLFD